MTQARAQVVKNIRIKILLHKCLTHLAIKQKAERENGFRYSSFDERYPTNLKDIAVGSNPHVISLNIISDSLSFLLNKPNHNSNSNDKIIIIIATGRTQYGPGAQLCRG